MADPRNTDPEPDPLPSVLSPDHPLFGLGYGTPVRTRKFARIVGDTSTPAEADISAEVPIALVYNARPHVVMMGTPSDLEDFAIGFSLTEEIVRSADRITNLEVVRHAQGIDVQMHIPNEDAERLANRGRQLVGRTGCGLCGVETINEAIRETSCVPPTARFSIDALWRAEAALPSLQEWNQHTGSLHAAVWMTADGTPVYAREDVGRHNALDKVVGALARAGRHAGDGFIVITSRASYELVQKATIAGVGLLAAVSRPTDLAIRMADAAGLTLVALLRGKSANVYTHPERLIGAASAD